MKEKRILEAGRDSVYIYNSFRLFAWIKVATLRSDLQANTQLAC